VVTEGIVAIEDIADTVVIEAIVDIQVKLEQQALQVLLVLPDQPALKETQALQAPPVLLVLQVQPETPAPAPQAQQEIPGQLDLLVV
jgi:hypothetical protein